MEENTYMNKLLREISERGGCCVDVALVIDVTADMSEYLSAFKEYASNIYETFLRSMEESGGCMGILRVKIISFRDYAFDGADAIADSRFFCLPDEQEAYQRYLDSLTAESGGDIPESALEALVLAMRSDWTDKGFKRRHVIALFTNAPVVPLKDPARMVNPLYPADMPENLAELEQMWHGHHDTLKGMPSMRSARMLVYAPDTYPWRELMDWNNVLVMNSDRDNRDTPKSELEGVFGILGSPII